MTEIQIRLFDMLEWLTTYFEENGYTYYVVGGTLLGAVRHNGFIPWDDDVDVALPRPDYERLLNEFSPGGSKYRLESPEEENSDFLYTYSKFYDTQTTLIERQKTNFKRGIYIDIFPLDAVGNSLEEAKQFSHSLDVRNMFLMARTCAVRKERKWYKNMAIYFARSIPFINDKKYSLRLSKDFARKDYQSNLYVANLNGAYRDKEIFEKKIFGKPKKYKFESIMVFGPEHSDEYLTQLYGDWKQLPPVEKRGKQHDFAYIDLRESYLLED